MKQTIRDPYQKRLEDITKEVIRNVIKRHINTLEQGLLIKCRNLVRIIQVAPKTRDHYTLNLPAKIVDPLSQDLQEYVESLFASDNDVDTEKPTSPPTELDT